MWSVFLDYLRRRIHEELGSLLHGDASQEGDHFSGTPEMRSIASISGLSGSTALCTAVTFQCG